MTFRCCNHQALAKSFVRVAVSTGVPLLTQHSKCTAQLPTSERNNRRSGDIPTKRTFRGAQRDLQMLQSSSALEKFLFALRCLQA